MAQRSIRIDKLIERARSRADMVDSEFWTAPELVELAEAKFQEFYLEFACDYDEFFTTRYAFTTTSGVSTVQITRPQLLKLRGVQRVEDLFFLRKLDLLETSDYVSKNETGRPRHYTLRIDPEIEFPFLDLYPTPDSAYGLTVFMVPIYGLQQLQQTLGESKALYMLAGWDEYVVVRMAIAMKDREESDCSVLIAEAATLKSSMQKQIKPTDLSEPAGVIQRGSRQSVSFYTDPEEYLG